MQLNTQQFTEPEHNKPSQELWSPELFAGVLRHDLAHALCITRITGDLLVANRANPEAFNLAHTRHMQAIDHLNQLFCGMRDTHGLAQKPEDFSEGELCEFTSKLLARGFLTKTGQMRVPEFIKDKDIRLNFSPTLIRHLVVNLVGNAVRYAQDSWVKVVLKDMGDYVKLSVANGGMGIPFNHMPYLFEPKLYTKPSAPNESGTGLGLFIAKRCVQLHGGTLLVSSKPGYTCFTARLPKQPL